MAFPPNVWNQLKNLTKDNLIGALKRDGWKQDPSSKGAELAYVKEQGSGRKRVVIHRHPRETCGPKLVKRLLAHIGWTVDDLRRVGLID
jgi:predicted RNA binding protein YcfA (HicA-like mRNA interferase family)